MLLKIKEKVTGWLAYVIVGLISVPFALWGINFYFQDDGDVTVVEVGDYEIGLRRFSELFFQNKRAAENNSSGEVSDNRIKQQTLISILRSQLLSQELENFHYVVPDGVLAEFLAQEEQFQVDGVFDRDIYLQFLRTNNYTQQSFEVAMREQLKRQQFNNALSESSFLTAPELQEHETFFYQERDINYIIFPLEKFVDLDSVSAERAQKHYENNKGIYATPLRVKFAYMEFNLEDVYPDVSFDEEELREYYENNQEAIFGQEERTVAHILFDSERHGGESEAEKVAYEVHEKLQQGEDFASLAKTYSDDSLTADLGGQLGSLTRDSIEDPNIEDAIFSLQVDEFSLPVSSRFGVQIFQLLKSRSSLNETFEQYRDIAEQQLRDRKAEELYDSRFFDIDTVIYEDVLSLEPARKAFELEINQTDWLTRVQADEPFANPEVAQIAFSDDFLASNYNSKLIEYGERRAVAFRIIEQEPAKQQTYAEAEDEIFMQLRLQEADKKAKEEIREMMLKLVTGSTTRLEVLASQYEVEVQAPGFIRRNTPDINPDVTKVAYSVKPSSETGRGYNMGKVSDGNYVLLEVSEVRQGEADPDQADFSRFNEELNVFLQGLTETISIYIDNEEITKIGGT